ncbi:hypothetical protein EXIGLDRAFT_483896 [Exidia glandulosa HHB12029]|uniref:Uncharacterized protein n=1 Tax=Exidia glandulosa HHB12029 TaxID=1314781 RepID=A0A165PJC7_EXIGL|nr:hypothetical protein EXIGLDRAFT_483896 [Exidia glandulosa HHB12029]
MTLLASLRYLSEPSHPNFAVLALATCSSTPLRMPFMVHSSRSIQSCKISGIRVRSSELVELDPTLFGPRFRVASLTTPVSSNRVSQSQRGALAAHDISSYPCNTSRTLSSLLFGIYGQLNEKRTVLIVKRTSYCTSRCVV